MPTLRDYIPALKQGIKMAPSDILGYAGVAGKDHYLVNAKTSSDNYYIWLTENGISDGDIYTGVQAAHDAMTSNRNDTLFVMPGTHLETVQLDLSKHHINLVGVGPIQGISSETGTSRITTATSGTVSLFEITGNFVSFYNINTRNSAANTANLADVTFAGGAENFSADYCYFGGGSNTTQNQNALAGVPILFKGDESWSGNSAKFKHCWIGSTANTTRTTGAGSVRYTANGSVQFTEYEDCIFGMRSETSGSTNPKFIHLTGNFAVDRQVWFKKCLFYNFVENHSVTMDYVVHNECGTTHDLIFQNSMFVGADAWSDSASSVKGVWTNTANAESDGGKAIEVDTTA